MAAKKLKFEEAMRRLQEIVGKLESGEVSLEESMKLFEEGAKLSSQCYQLLDKAEQQVTQLAKIPLEEEVQDEGDI
jgi:exodeoxyribonuclease VII small subunit